MPTGWMSDVEALMWNVERDPYLDPTFGSLTVLEGTPDVDHLRRRLLRMVERNPRFGQRVVAPAGRLTPPAWTDDPDFDVDHHLLRARVPAPAGRRELFDMAARLMNRPLDRERPLWEFHLLEGLEGGGTAILEKVHHTITDGEGGLRIALEILDQGPEMPDLGEPGPDEGPRSAPGTAGLLLGAAGFAARRAGEIGCGVAVGAADLAVHPTRVPDALTATVETARSVLGQITVEDRSRSPLWTERTLRRRLDGVEVPLEPLQEAARRLGGTVNDAFVVALTTAIGRLHREAGLPVDELRMAMPVSTRQRGASGGNAFVPTRLLVPVGEGDLRARFAAVHELLDRAKADRVLGVVDQLAMVANLLPVPLVARVLREQSRAVDFAASNVRGAPMPLWLGGTRVVADYPIGPLTAAALNVSLLSYAGTCHLGVHSDAGAVADADRLVELIEEAFAEVLAAP